MLEFVLSMLQTVLEEDQKFFKLLELLGQYHEEGSVLVFVDKQEHADELMKDLLKYSYPCLSLHGGIDQFDRGSIISDFKNGNVRLLVSYRFCMRKPVFVVGHKKTHFLCILVIIIRFFVALFQK